MASCWSGRRGSNSLPPPWQGGALPDELRPQIRCSTAPFGDASDRNRTNDTGIFSPLLYRLSYRGISGAIIPAPSHSYFKRGPRKNLRSKVLWGRGGISEFVATVLLVRPPDKCLTFRRATRIGLEPTTPSVTGWCSNQLSYRAMIAQVCLAVDRRNVCYYT